MTSNDNLSNAGGDPEQDSQPRFPAAAIRLLTGTAWVTSILLLAIFCWSVKKRLTFPYAYDWIEDGILSSVRHIRAGMPLYASPSVRFTPFIYAPLYFYVSALVSHVFGVTYTTLRLVSVLSVVGCLTAIYVIVYTETKNKLASVVAVSTFIACYATVQFDGGHVDMLSLCLVMWAIVCSGRSRPLLASLLWVAAFQTKQGILPIALLFLFWDWKKPKVVLLGLSSFFVLYFASIWFLNHVTHGWYGSYVFGEVHGITMDTYLIKRYIPNDLLHPYGIAFLVVVAALILRAPHWKSPKVSFYLAGTLGMIVFTAIIRANPRSSWNSLLPAYLWTSVLFGVAIGWLLNWLQRLERQRFVYRDALTAVVLCAVILQLAELLYSPTPFLPTPGTLARRRALTAQIDAIPGTVLVASHPEESESARKPSFATTESIYDVVNAPKRSLGDPLMQEYETLFRSGTLRALVLDSTVEDTLATGRVWLPQDTATLFPLRITAFGADADQFGLRPKWIYFPCSQQQTALRMDPGVDLSACSTGTHP